MIRLGYLPRLRFQACWVHTAYRPLAFYRLAKLSRMRTMELQEEIRHGMSQRGVLGRIYLADRTGIGGINCQLSVPLTQLGSVQAFFKNLENDLGPIEYTQGMHDTSLPTFQKLRVLTKRNLVALREDQMVEVADLIPESLTPQQWHEELEEKGKEAFLLDMRNHYEYTLGHFDHAIKMNVATFRDGISLLDSLVEQQPKEKDIYMYCTGGIRCSIAGPYLKQKGFQHVKMLKGGISAYGHYVREQGQVSLFKGQNYVFDDRKTERITNDVLTRCYQCGSACDHVTNCKNHHCHLLFTQCDACRSRAGTCSAHCQDVVEGKDVYRHDYDYHQQVGGIA
ncbi:Rhodanese-like domain-containing protein [Sporodiniella umbellata]|nr:Rhodanese-like domain-containing protein [Sporodiniella umbellata]